MRRWKFRNMMTRPEAPAEVIEGPVGTSVIYDDIRYIVGPLADDLNESDKESASRLLDMALYCAPVLHGLEEIRQHFRLLGSWPDFDPDLAGIFRQAAEHVYDGIQACIFTPGRRVMDQSRFLMEVEFLLYDFNTRPESLDIWRTASPFRRNQQFGFGKLRARREKDPGFEVGTVLPDRDEYSVHSAQVHPRPAKELTSEEETPQRRRFYLMSDLTDLYQHALRVLRASADTVRIFARPESVEADDHPGRPVEPDVIDQANEFINNWTAKFKTPPRPSSVPVKGIDWRALQIDPGH